jgi:hypothetical protein
MPEEIYIAGNQFLKCVTIFSNLECLLSPCE